MTLDHEQEAAEPPEPAAPTGPVISHHRSPSLASTICIVIPCSMAARRHCVRIDPSLAITPHLPVVSLGLVYVGAFDGQGHRVVFQ